MLRVCILAVTLLAPPVAAEEPSANDLLKAMLARDARFDNVKLAYDVRGEHTTTPFPAWKFPELAKQNGRENEKPVTIPVHFHETLVVRGRDVTFTRQDASPAATGGGADEARWRMTPAQKWRNINGVATEISRTGMTGRGHAIMEICSSGSPVTMVQHQVMAVEFAHGFGFGKRIRDIDSIVREGDLLRVEGTIHIWWEDDSRFSLLLDEDYLVRQARIESDVRGHRTVYDVTTEGTATASGFTLAAKGTYIKTVLGTERNGVSPAPKIEKQFQTEFTGIEADLDDATYAALIAMPMEPDMQVNDRIAGTTTFIEQKPFEISDLTPENMGEFEHAILTGNVRLPDPPAATSLPSTGVNWPLLIGLCIGLTIVWLGLRIWLLLRGRRRREEIWQEASLRAIAKRESPKRTED